MNITQDVEQHEEEWGYLKGAVHQSLIQVYDHTDLPLVLGRHLRQEAGLVLLRTHISIIIIIIICPL